MPLHLRYDVFLRRQVKGLNESSFFFQVTGRQRNPGTGGNRAGLHRVTEDKVGRVREKCFPARRTPPYNRQLRNRPVGAVHQTKRVQLWNSSETTCKQTVPWR